MKAIITLGDKTAALQDTETPKPEAGEILVKVAYVAQNPTDWKATAAVPAGRTVGCDFAGTVEDPNGSHWRQGQRVAGFVQGTAVSPTRGVFAEYAVIEASLVYAVPDEVSFADAAVIPLAFATAVQAMFQRLDLPEPSKPATSPFPLLVYGGSSSVGSYAIQLGKLAGLFVITAASKSNHEQLKALGADACVDYNDGDWVDQVRKISHDGLQHAFDTISEKGSTLAISRAMSPAKGGRIVTLLPTDKSEIENNKVTVQSTIVYTVFERPIKYGAFDNCGEATPADKAVWEKYLASLPGMLTDGKLKPNRAREFGTLKDIPAGFEEQRQGRVRGEKLVYKVA